MYRTPQYLAIFLLFLMGCNQNLKKQKKEPHKTQNLLAMPIEAPFSHGVALAAARIFRVAEINQFKISNTTTFSSKPCSPE